MCPRLGTAATLPKGSGSKGRVISGSSQSWESSRRTTRPKNRYKRRSALLVTPSSPAQSSQRGVAATQSDRNSRNTRCDDFEMRRAPRNQPRARANQKPTESRDNSTLLQSRAQPRNLLVANQQVETDAPAPVIKSTIPTNPRRELQTNPRRASGSRARTCGGRRPRAGSRISRRPASSPGSSCAPRFGAARARRK
jgi:hypothetical protein